VATVTDPASNTTTYGSSYIQSARYVASVTGPACASCNPQSTSSYGYDANGNRTSMVDGNGNTITYTTDANSNQTSISTTTGERADHQAAMDLQQFRRGAHRLIRSQRNHNVYDPRQPAHHHHAVARWRHTPASVTTFTYNTNGTLKTIKDLSTMSPLLPTTRLA